MKKLLKRFLQSLPAWTLRNYIVFESAPDCSDNTRAVFDEMIRRGLNKKYKMIWLIKDQRHAIDGIKNVKCVPASSRARRRYVLQAKCLVSCNQKLHSYRKGQYSIYLGHGMPVKSLRVASPAVSENITNWLSMSSKMTEIFSYEFNMPAKQSVSLGYPRNDEFYRSRVDLHHLFDVDFDKIVVWYPTFRQNHGGISASDSDIALPVIHNEQNAIALNEFAKQQKLLIVLKPHFAQDVSCLLNLNLPYIKFINDEFLFDNHISSYQFVNGCDALLTDYSSIYFDFLITNRPIGLTWEDYDDYAKRPGFAIDMDDYMAGGEKIYTQKDLIDFLTRVVNGQDDLKNERARICQLIQQHHDGQSARRVVDFILQNLSTKSKKG